MAPKRIERHKDFFERAWKLQIRCGALFGEDAEDALLLLQKARREVEVWRICCGAIRSL